MKKRLFVDMDGVLCIFNKEASIEELTSAGYFSNLLPQESVKDAITLLLDEDNVEIFILSSVFQDDHSANEKADWLNSYGLEAIDESHRLFAPYGTSKSSYLEETVGLKKDDFLLDDFSKNLHEWHGTGIKLYNGINGTKGTWFGYSVHAKCSADIIANTLLGIMQYAA